MSGEEQPTPDGVGVRGGDEHGTGEPGGTPAGPLDVTPAGPLGVTPAGPLGAGTFSLEGRAAPGLYFVGWFGTIVGLGVIGVALLSGGQIAAAVLALVGVVLLTVGLFSAAGAQALQRRRLATAPYAGPSPFLVFAATIPPTIVLGALAVIPLVALGVGPLDASPAALLVSLVVTTVVYVASIRLLVVGPGALSWRDMGLVPSGTSRWRDLAAGAALAIPIVILTSILADVLVAILGATPPSVVPLNTGTGGLILNLLSAAVVTPFGEELFFRGFATTAWVRGLGERGGLLRGALFFAVIHVLLIGGSSFDEALRAAIVGFVGRIPVSIALGWIFLRRRSLYASIGLHATFNATLVILSEVVARNVGF
ncbi:MAG TPA: type II CAAX endopeptidase family protein [Candidatus Limnocylindrales bacterium]